MGPERRGNARFFPEESGEGIKKKKPLAIKYRRTQLSKPPYREPCTHLGGYTETGVRVLLL